MMNIMTILKRCGSAQDSTMDIGLRMREPTMVGIEITITIGRATATPMAGAMEAMMAVGGAEDIIKKN